MKTSNRILYYKINGGSFLLINSITGAIDIVNSDVYDYLTKYGTSDTHYVDVQIVAKLQQRGYLVDGDHVEQALFERIANLYEQRGRQLSFVICPTYSCNLRCTYCFEGELPSTNRLFMSDKDLACAFAAIDELRERYANHEHFVQLFGGEPLLPKTSNIVRDVLEGARYRSLEVSITTNGTHMDQFIDLLREYADILRAVQVTLDGPKSMHDVRRKNANDVGSFDAVCSAIELLLSAGIKVVARVNIDFQNIDVLPELFDFMVERKWPENDLFTCNLSPVQDHACTGAYPHTMPEDKLVEQIFSIVKGQQGLEETYKLNMFRALRHIRAVIEEGRPKLPLPYYCEANNLENMVFGPDGYIYACTECIGREAFAIGKFIPVLEMNAKTSAMWGNRTILTIDECRACDIALLCGGGCAYSALMVNGDINKPVCNRIRETIFAYLDYVRDDLVKLAKS
ncbi:MAG TPA: radical SAM protein [Candidatus Aquicultor sp.]|jgi:uncharacterized protein